MIPPRSRSTRRTSTQVLARGAVALGPELVAPSRVRATYAGLRVLPAGPGESASARRETVYTIGPGGMLSVAGGKLTTYRRIALDALARFAAELGIHRLDRRPWPLPDAPPARAGRLRPSFRRTSASHLIHLYGSRAAEVLRRARGRSRAARAAPSRAARTSPRRRGYAGERSGR